MLFPVKTVSMITAMSFMTTFIVEDRGGMTVVTTFYKIKPVFIWVSVFPANF